MVGRCYFGFSVIAIVVTVALTTHSGDAVAQSAESILNSRCAGCHEATADGGLSRIKDMRKTPEGWDMAIARMTVVHGVELSAEERAALVKHLADTQGLAPEETAAYRYVLERRPNEVEAPGEGDLMVMCGRCHTLARSALQRRDAGEWTKLAHFHLGQFPTTEYQALGRDRNWWEIASTEVPKQLGRLYPLETAAWTQWLGHKKADLSGTWHLAGRRPGKGAYSGVMEVSATGADVYSVSLKIAYANGEKAGGSGNAVVYTGYEWRARLDLGGESVLQVFALSADGNELSGRWFLEEHDALGGDQRAIRQGSGSQIVGVSPGYMKKQHNQIITISGTGLGGDVDLGPDVRIVKIHSSSASKVVVEAMATSAAAAGPRNISVGGASAADGLVVYDKVDAVRVEPGEAIARVGGGGGPLPPVPAQFEAVAYLNGPDGEAGTDDDQRIGVMPATWSVDNFNEVAAGMEDTKYAGSITAGGLFEPAAAGLNPERPFSTNNAGDLLVKAAVDDGGTRVEGTGHLIVTVQRWIDPPIR
jgi:quinohemoprotein amine dehydrogenase